MTLAIAALFACGDDDGASMRMLESCTVICECGFDDVNRINQCIDTCVNGPPYKDACNACIAMHDRQCTTVDADCMEACN